MEESTPASRYLELSHAIQELRERGLAQSVKWAAEQLVGLGPDAAAAAAMQSALDSHGRTRQSKTLSSK